MCSTVLLGGLKNIPIDGHVAGRFECTVSFWMKIPFIVAIPSATYFLHHVL